MNFDFIHEWLISLGVNADYASYFQTGILFIGILIISFLANFITKKWIVSLVHRIAEKTKNNWDDIIAENHVFTRLSHIVPALIILFSSHTIFANYEYVDNIVQSISYVYLIGAFWWVINSLLNAVSQIYNQYEVSKRIHIKSFMQVIRFIFIVIAGILIFSVFLGISPGGIFAGLGALAAVLMFVFKEPILNIYTSIQLIANEQIKIGDWIVMPKYGADGDVVEINMTSVKVQNFDKTVVTVPTSQLIMSDVKNWRYMRESGGRRIKRALNIDMNTVKHCNDSMITKFKQVEILKPYLEEKEKEIKEYNESHVNSKLLVNTEIPMNGRNLTNLGTFRRYVSLYLKHNSKIHSDNFTFLVRQLEPTETGVPIQIYVFTTTVVWADYEEIQSDIFDHIIASVPFFDLRVYQRPSGHDIRSIVDIIRK